MWRKPTRPQARAAVWALRAHLVTRRRLRNRQVEEVHVPTAPRLGVDATRGVDVVLRLTRATCLERSVVLQQWYAAQGIARDVVIGVTAPRAGFRAHAWLEEPGMLTHTEFTEITRLPGASAAAMEGSTR